MIQSFNSSSSPSSSCRFHSCRSTFAKKSPPVSICQFLHFFYIPPGSSSFSTPLSTLKLIFLVFCVCPLMCNDQTALILWTGGFWVVTLCKSCRWLPVFHQDIGDHIFITVNVSDHILILISVDACFRHALWDHRMSTLQSGLLQTVYILPLCMLIIKYLGSQSYFFCLRYFLSPQYFIA
jgi:hypothetical protein